MLFANHFAFEGRQYRVRYVVLEEAMNLLVHAHWRGCERIYPVAIRKVRRVQLQLVSRCCITGSLCGFRSQYAAGGLVFRICFPLLPSWLCNPPCAGRLGLKGYSSSSTSRPCDPSLRLAVDRKRFILAARQKPRLRIPTSSILVDEQEDSS